MAEHFSPDDISYFQELAFRWQQGTITAEEKILLENWYYSNQDSPIEISPSFVKDEESHEQRILQNIKNKIASESEVVILKHSNRKKWYTIAATLFLLIVSSAIWWTANSRKTIFQDTISKRAKRNDIAPGHAGAILHLSNGTTLILDSLKNGQVAQQGNVKVVKINGELKYIGKTNEILYNDIVTAKGRQWKMTLPDGTKVWLNAASSIHYPLSFTDKERLVEITGEAYFEVVHNPLQPFKVKAGNQIIEDIGTSFDVNAYNDEPTFKTTLIKGAVKVGNILLHPNQQAIGTNNNLIIKTVNAKDVTAWVNGQLSMENISLKELMRQLSRWYDIDIEYVGNISNKRFGGLINRNAYLSDIIKVLKNYGIGLKLEGEKIIVSQS